MDSDLTCFLKELIRTTTRSASLKDWKDAVRTSTVPLHNYRENHVRIVVETAKSIAEKTDANVDIVTIAAWLHDVAKPGLGGEKNHGLKSAQFADKILKEKGVDASTIERIKTAIRCHVGLTLEKPLDTLEAKIIWDADKLVKLGVVGFLHMILNGILLTPGLDLWEIAEKIRRFIPLAEKISENMQTKLGKTMAAERVQTLKRIARALEQELLIERGCNYNEQSELDNADNICTV